MPFILILRNFPTQAFTFFCTAPYTKISTHINMLLYTSMPPKDKFQVWPDTEKDILTMKLRMLRPQGFPLHKLYAKSCVPNFVLFFLKWVLQIVGGRGPTKAKCVPDIRTLFRWSMLCEVSHSSHLGLTYFFQHKAISGFAIPLLHVSLSTWWILNT